MFTLSGDFRIDWNNFSKISQLTTLAVFHLAFVPLLAGVLYFQQIRGRYSGMF